MNKKLLPMLALVGASFSATTQAAVLEHDYKITVVAINGELITKEQKIDDTHVRLPDTQAQILVKADGLFKDGSDNEYFTSKPYVLSYNASKKALLKLPKNMTNFSKAKKAFSTQSPQWRLTDMSGSAVAYETELLPPKPGFFPYGDIEALLEKYNKKQGIYIVNDEIKEIKNMTVSYDEQGRMTETPQIVTAGTTSTKAAQPQMKKQASSNAMGAVDTESITQLKLWYNKASTAEKRIFRHWMLDQDL